MPKAPWIQPARSWLVPVPRSPQTEVCCPCRWCRTSWWWSHPWPTSAGTHTAQPPLASQQRRLLETPGQWRMLARKLAAAQSQGADQCGPNDGDIVVGDTVGRVCSFSFTWQDRDRCDRDYLELIKTTCIWTSLEFWFSHWLHKKTF